LKKEAESIIRYPAQKILRLHVMHPDTFYAYSMMSPAAKILQFPKLQTIEEWNPGNPDKGRIFTNVSKNVLIKIRQNSDEILMKAQVFSYDVVYETAYNFLSMVKGKYICLYI
jgi:hypothetical protein